MYKYIKANSDYDESYEVFIARVGPWREEPDEYDVITTYVEYSSSQKPKTFKSYNRALKYLQSIASGSKSSYNEFAGGWFGNVAMMTQVDSPFHCVAYIDYYGNLVEMKDL